MGKDEPNRWVLLAARLLVALTFLVLGLTKVSNPLLFAREIHVYEILPAEPQFLINLTALLLPWFEIVCGLLLALGACVRATTLALGALLAGFTGAILYRTLVIWFTEEISFWAIHFDCEQWLECGDFLCFIILFDLLQNEFG